jgi:uncharacterized iron-regulated protein
MRILHPVLFAALLLLSATGLQIYAQKPAYRLYTAEGRKSTFEKMVDAAADADVVLFGEQHDNPIAHWLQIELTRSLHEGGGRIVLGAEMFEADNQLILDEYLAGLISGERFEEEARIWNNYTTDYKPLVEFAKEQGLRFIATNIPRRYANAVFKQGMGVLESFSGEAKQYIAPLPVEYDTTLSSYSSLRGGGGMMGHGSANLADAQAVKDATMAYLILQNRKPGALFLHFNGAYHSDHYQGINWFLKRSEPALGIVTITTVVQDDIDSLDEEFRGRADFVICVPSTMTRTY